MNELARIIYKIEGIPHDLKALFNTFVEIFTNKEFWIKGTKYQIMDIGPQEQLSTTFQLFPSEGGLIQMKISFIETPSGVDISYNNTLEIITPKGIAGKMMRKMMENQKDFIQQAMDSQMIPLVINSIQESVKLPEDVKEEKPTKAESSQDPIHILKIQFAEGKISEEEYRRKRKILEE